MLICQNAEGVHGKRKVGNPCFRPLVTQDLSCLQMCLTIFVGMCNSAHLSIISVMLSRAIVKSGEFAPVKSQGMENKA